VVPTCRGGHVMCRRGRGGHISLGRPLMVRAGVDLGQLLTQSRTGAPKSLLLCIGVMTLGQGPGVVEMLLVIFTVREEKFAVCS
ncbi:hypothetical protein A2U01_0071024, partial [Trifolium medium]|nr:hypothetical protein [Trifolium medium]